MPKAARPVANVTNAELIEARKILFDGLRKQLADPAHDARMKEILRAQAGRAAKLYGFDEHGEFDKEFPPPPPCTHRCAEHGDPAPLAAEPEPVAADISDATEAADSGKPTK